MLKRIPIIFKPMNNILPAINKITLKEYESFMTYTEWINFKKSSKFHYKVIMLNLC